MKFLISMNISINKDCFEIFLICSSECLGFKAKYISKCD